MAGDFTAGNPKTHRGGAQPGRIMACKVEPQPANGPAAAGICAKPRKAGLSRRISAIMGVAIMNMAIMPVPLEAPA
jgi:hypothetical protein